MKTTVILNLIKSPDLPVEAENLIPDTVDGKTLTEIYELPILYGNTFLTVKDFFEGVITTEEGDGIKLVIEGDCTRIKRIGQEMTYGEIVINGSAGFHAGAQMKGGKLSIMGDAGDWLGAQMIDGLIIVEGNAGHSIGAAYRGNLKGMLGGTIIVKGNAGHLLGAKMRGGVIAVGGNCLDSMAYHMNAGTILLSGNSGQRLGAGVVRGTIILLSENELMPTYYSNCIYIPTFWGLLLTHLKSYGFSIDEKYTDTSFMRYSGDILEGGKGEILLCQTI